MLTARSEEPERLEYSWILAFVLDLHRKATPRTKNQKQRQHSEFQDNRNHQTSPDYKCHRNFSWAAIFELCQQCKCFGLPNRRSAEPAGIADYFPNGWCSSCLSLKQKQTTDLERHCKRVAECMVLPTGYLVRRPCTFRFWPNWRPSLMPGAESLPMLRRRRTGPS